MARWCYSGVSELSCRFAVTETGDRIAFDICFAPDCGRHISRCVCEDGPTPPPLGASAGAVTVEPLAQAPAA